MYCFISCQILCFRGLYYHKYLLQSEKCKEVGKYCLKICISETTVVLKEAFQNDKMKFITNAFEISYEHKRFE